ncbi:MAG TPA: TraR/DksA C4-type zinc finger protein [Anaeromyxobacteraceae bacterium]|nr:TraR/DksA C4-type zinc finger protein [Anaeromyxobacteraceae bacterium]
MRASELEALKLRLLGRRQAILIAGRRTAAGIDQLRRAERDAEIEEASQSEQLQYDLSRLGEVERSEVAQIDAALRRLEAGEYGVCRDCGEEIEPGRLEALPFALECADCAGRREEAQALQRELAGKRRTMTPR